VRYGEWKTPAIPGRIPNLFSREINYQVLSNSEFNQILYMAIRALPHIQDLHRPDELKRALCELLLPKMAWRNRPTSKSSFGT
jgi:hypothetical protein